MGNVGESLKRKLGPLPVWAWALVVGGVLYVVRGRGASVSTGTNSVQATQAEAALIQAEGQASAINTQASSILSPGESVYDPNTGFLSNGNPNTGLTESLVGLVGALLLPQPAGQSAHNRGKGKLRGRPKSHLKKQPKHPGHNHSDAYLDKHKLPDKKQDKKQNKKKSKGHTGT